MTLRRAREESQWQIWPPGLIKPVGVVLSSLMSGLTFGGLSQGQDLEWKECHQRVEGAPIWRSPLPPRCAVSTQVMLPALWPQCAVCTSPGLPVLLYSQPILYLPKHSSVPDLCKFLMVCHTVQVLSLHCTKPQVQCVSPSTGCCDHGAS